MWNRGKESLVADLRTPEGQQTVRELAAAADVVIDGFAPGRTNDWGIGASTLTAGNPALVRQFMSAGDKPETVYEKIYLATLSRKPT